MDTSDLDFNRPNLYCLLPVRNGAAFLPMYFQNVRRFARGIVALDDGSNDATSGLLASEPLVKMILHNARRPSYKEWDDSKNRSLLLAASSQFSPDWILWLDADELIADCDIPSLLALLVSGADRSLAYGFEVLRMMGDLGHFDRNKLWVFRLFARTASQSLPQRKLHFDPIPLELPRSNWRRTRIRILHRAGLTRSMRLARYRKYRECDPRREWQDCYHSLLDPPGHIWELKPLPKDSPIVID